MCCWWGSKLRVPVALPCKGKAPIHIQIIHIAVQSRNNYQFILIVSTIVITVKPVLAFVKCCWFKFEGFSEHAILVCHNPDFRSMYPGNCTAHQHSWSWKLWVAAKHTGSILKGLYSIIFITELFLSFILISPFKAIVSRDVNLAVVQEFSIKKKNR